jgi:hypothetical protein
LVFEKLIQVLVFGCA